VSNPDPPTRAPVPVRFLLGPAGTGKTWRCLAEVRAELRAASAGAPLVLLAPKQATFQLERQVLEEAALPGYTRLRILSFQRLAEWILASTAAAVPPLLSDEGRVMVLRALLMREQSRLRVFHATARLPGLAHELARLLRELQQHKLSPARLERMADQLAHAGPLRDKLLDFAWLLGRYRDWLQTHRLQDADRLLELATSTAITAQAQPQPESPVHLAGLWLDGFAEMTPQELDLLTAVLPLCQQATLAFCLPGSPNPSERWLSSWATVAGTYWALHDRLAAIPHLRLDFETLARRPCPSRFDRAPTLAHLERHWTDRELAGSQPSSASVESAGGEPANPSPPPRTDPGEPAPSPDPTDAARPAVELGDALRLVACADRETEALEAAREIQRFVRDSAGRYREIAVLVRSLDDYHDVLRRAFARQHIPFFLDRRESVAHHPLPELTRYALRLVASGWRHDDWFGALKTGLVHADEVRLDELENEALARGWQGEDWLHPLRCPGQAELEARLERLRQAVLGPFLDFHRRLARPDTTEPPPPLARSRTATHRTTTEPTPTPPTPPETNAATAAGVAGTAVRAAVPPGPLSGAQLAAGLRLLWLELEVPARLAEWGVAPGRSRQSGSRLPLAQVHATVWEQMNAWLGNLALAFADESLPLRDWLPIIEAGLARLTAGVVPPALDQVLVGAIDRSRNPDLQRVILLGWNDGVFPAPPDPSRLLSQTDREALLGLGAWLGPDPRRQIARERYYGYIACTRPRQGLVVTYARQDPEGLPLNPSPFVARLSELFPGLTVEESTGPAVLPRQAPRAGEAAPCRVGVESDPGSNDRAPTRLTPALALALYGPQVLHSSVSRLELFAACPFRFFVSSGLAAEERRRFEIDARHRGSFQHEVLARFHEEVTAAGLRWRDLEPAEARVRLQRIARDVPAAYGEGIFQADDASLFDVRSLQAALEDFIEVQVDWLRSAYAFDPSQAELAFGIADSRLPAFTLPLDEGRVLALHGKIDRVDLAADTASHQVRCLIVDYKSGPREIDAALLAAGVQMQLPVYLAAFCQLAQQAGWFGQDQLVPAGMFYVNLRGQRQHARSRTEALAGLAATRRLAYQHHGRFDLAALPWLDRTAPGSASGQFAFRFRKDGTPYARAKEALSSTAFHALLQTVTDRLRAMGTAILAGEASVDPYLRGSGATACDHCDYRSICRIDPWTHAYRRLEP